LFKISKVLQLILKQFVAQYVDYILQEVGLQLTEGQESNQLAHYQLFWQYFLYTVMEIISLT
jgi:hypothetical protein